MADDPQTSAQSKAARAAVEKLVDEQKFEAAAAECARIRESARAAGDNTLWTWALIKEGQLRSALHGYETAVRFFKEQPWPASPVEHDMLELFYAHSLVTYYQAYSWEINNREKVESKGPIDLKSWTRDQIFDEAWQSLLRVWKDRDRLAAHKSAQFPDFWSPGDYPAGVRDSLRDGVVYLMAELLADTSFWTPRQSNETWLLDLAKILSQRRQDKRRRRGRPPRRRRAPPRRKGRRPPRRTRGLEPPQRPPRGRPRGPLRARQGPLRGFRRGRRPGPPPQAPGRVPVREPQELLVGRRAGPPGRIHAPGERPGRPRPGPQDRPRRLRALPRLPRRRPLPAHRQVDRSARICLRIDAPRRGRPPLRPHHPPQPRPRPPARLRPRRRGRDQGGPGLQPLPVRRRGPRDRRQTEARRRLEGRTPEDPGLPRPPHLRQLAGKPGARPLSRRRVGPRGFPGGGQQGRRGGRIRRRPRPGQAPGRRCRPYRDCPR